MMFVANPHALLIDGVVTEVVYMQDYDSEQIKEALSKKVYDEVINCSEYGKELFVGNFRIGDYIVGPRPNPNWEFNHKLGDWEPSKEHQDLLQEGLNNGFDEVTVNRLKNIGEVTLTPSKERPFKSWKFNKDLNVWEPPVNHPNDGLPYMWDENNLSWFMCSACTSEINTYGVEEYANLSREKSK
jgi:hypothetical protein